jgi:hypothetical protein
LRPIVKAVWKTFAEVIITLGALACILVWLGIKPSDLRMNPTGPHIAWLIAGLVLFALSITMSMRSLRANLAARKLAGDSIAEMGAYSQRQIDNARALANNSIREKDNAIAELEKNSSALARLISLEVGAGDPQVFAEFCDDRGATFGTHNEAYLTLVNRGGCDALDVCIEPIRLKGHTIKFPQLTYKIEPGHKSDRYPDVVTSDNRTPHSADVFHLMFLEYDSLGDNSIHELAIPLTIYYQDSAHNLYDAQCELVFSWSAHLRVRSEGKHGGIEVVKTRNHKFQRLAVAVEPLTRAMSNET